MLYFAHGNGFPVETYHQLLKLLNNHFGTATGYISCLGHNPDFPVIKDWSNLADEIIDYVSKNYSDKVVAIGHSLGGVVSYWACVKRPDLFKGLVIMDSPIYSGFKNMSISFIKALGLIEYFTPARNTRNRKYMWDSYQEALEHFKNKRVFRYYTDLCMRDYVYFGTEKIIDEDKKTKVKLRFDPMVEWKIYRTLPSIIFPKLPESIPCKLIYGQYSKVVSDKDAEAMAKNYNFSLQKLDNCGHLLPFERPEATAEAIIRFIECLN